MRPRGCTEGRDEGRQERFEARTWEQKGLVSTDGDRPAGAPTGEPGRNAVALGNGAEAAAFPAGRGPAAFAPCAEGSDAAAKPRPPPAMGLPIPAIASARARGRATCVGLRCA